MREYRKSEHTARETRKKRKKQQEEPLPSTAVQTFDSRSDARETSLSPTEPAQNHGLAYYPAIFYFHVLLGTLITLIIVSRVAAANPERHDIGTMDVIWLGADVLALILFCIEARRLRPDVLRHDIEDKRQIWSRVFGLSKD